ncbi:MAG: hypothetical protein RIM99_00220 [Cyclobacteriaceae bacterium]
MIRICLITIALFISSGLISQDRDIYYSGGYGYSDLFRTNAEGTIVRLTNRESRGEYQPQVSPDGKYIVFNTYRYGGWKLAIAELQNGDIKPESIRKLVTDSKGYEYDADWSADGKSIVYVGFTSGRSGGRQVFITDLSGKNVRQLTDDDRNHYSPNFSPDDQSIYFQATIDGAQSIQRLLIRTGEIETILHSDDAHHVAPSLSPNGRLLAFHKIHTDESVTTHVLNLADNTAQTLYGVGEEEKNYLNRQSETPVFSYGIGWSANSRKIVFTRHNGNFRFELFIADLSTNSVMQLTRLNEASLQPSWY